MHASLSKLKDRTFRVTFRFPADETPQRSKLSRSPSLYRNPVILAQEWQQAFKSGAYGTQANFARKRGISRSRVTQVLHLLNLAPDVLHAIAALGDPLTSRTVTERVLRSLVHRPADEQRQEIGSILARATTEQQFQLDLADLSSPNSSEES
jgi:hypothetical protein